MAAKVEPDPNLVGIGSKGTLRSESTISDPEDAVVDSDLKGLQIVVGPWGSASLEELMLLWLGLCRIALDLETVMTVVEYIVVCLLVWIWLWLEEEVEDTLS